MTKKYEEMIEELREIVKRIEDGEISLEESIALYERGDELVKACEDLLTTAEARVTTLSRED
jgi:exodeoxyribonuclease VII small subunit